MGANAGSSRQRLTGSKLAQSPHQVWMRVQLPSPEGVIIRAARRVGLPPQELQQRRIVRKIGQLPQRFHIGSLGVLPASDLARHGGVGDACG